MFRRKLINKGSVKLCKNKFKVYFRLCTRTYASIYSENLTGLMFQFYLSLKRFACKRIGLVAILVTKLYQNPKLWNYENSDSLIANKTEPGNKNILA